MRRALVVGLLICLLVSAWPASSHGQQAVVDVGAIAQLVLMLQQMLQLVGLSTKDLMALSNLPVALQLAQDIMTTYDEVSGLVSELDTRYQGWSQLAGSGAGLCDGASYAAWAGQASEWSRQGVDLVMDVRRLVGRMVTMMGSVQRLASTIGSLTGSTSGLMALNAQAAATNTTLTQFMAALMPQQQQQAAAQLMQDVTTRAMACMKARRFLRE